MVRKCRRQVYGSTQLGIHKTKHMHIHCRFTCPVSAVLSICLPDAATWLYILVYTDEEQSWQEYLTQGEERETDGLLETSTPLLFGLLTFN